MSSRFLSSFLFRYLLLLVILLVMPAFQVIQAQNADAYITKSDTNLIYKVTKYSKVYYIGKILSIDERELLMLLPVRGKLIIPAHEVRTIEVLEQVEMDASGNYIDPDADLTHYMLNTHARGLKRNEAELAFSLLGPDIIVGLSDRKSIRTSTSWIGTPLLMTYSYQLPLAEKLDLSLGLLGISSTWASPVVGIVVPYAGITLGSRRNNLTFTGGYGKFYKRGNSYAMPYFSIAGISSLGHTWSVVYDSYLVNLDQDEWNSQGPYDFLTYQFMAAVAARWNLGRSAHLQFGGGILGIAGDVYPLPIIQYIKKF